MASGEFRTVFAPAAVDPIAFGLELFAQMMGESGRRCHGGCLGCCFDQHPSAMLCVNGTQPGTPSSASIPGGPGSGSMPMP